MADKYDVIIVGGGSNVDQDGTGGTVFRATLSGTGASVTAGGGTVTLTRGELVRLIEDAVERFGGAGRGRA